MARDKDKSVMGAANKMLVVSFVKRNLLGDELTETGELRMLSKVY